MRCAYAFLLIPNHSMSQMERLVVVGVDQNYSHYGVYKPQITGKFPEVTSAPDIIMTQYSINNPGTYVRAYCSFNIPAIDIVAAIKADLEDITYSSHRNFNVNEEELALCRARIQAIPFGQNETSAISLQYLTHNNPCTVGEVFNLNFRQELRIVGDYTDFINSFSIAPIWIYADSPVNIQQILSHDHIYGEVRNEDDFRFTDLMAWFQGHLHIFRVRWRISDIIVMTVIGREAANPSRLLNGLLKNFKNSEELVTIVKKVNDNFDIWDSDRSISWYKYPAVKLQMLEVERKIRRFNFGSLPIFHFSSEIM
ncbi:BgtA-20598 [Blumeria graminis f. sp. tritici]|uniref:BgtA-20598 n=2 Tax=Blumeria graminis f. sp. tritici TaxID=62690 RepID=A0A9X9MJ08_BLUGR|nr:BgtA-20598 [Blumeria graminis f. sp. tritici]